MIINRHNYEEFFILYLDNELSAPDRRQVELFVQQHPDLGEELQMLQQTRLQVDHTAVFERKESLMKFEATGFINSANYEEWLVQYIDNELNGEQKAAVESYLANNPAVSAELELLQKTKLQPEGSIVFLNKESLYRREEAPVRSIVPVRWMRVAVAVLLLIALTVGSITIYNNSKTPDKGLAATDIKNSTPVADNIKKKVDEPPSTVTATATDQSTEEQSGKKETNELAVEKKNIMAKTVRKFNEEDIPVIANVNYDIDNNLPDTYRDTDIKNAARTPDLADAGLTIPQENTPRPLVTSGTAQSFIQAKNTLPDDEEVAVNEPEKRTKFRGLLRTLTRTFEKTTNIKATDDQDRLLVAGLAIRL